MEDRENSLKRAKGTHFGGPQSLYIFSELQSLCLLNCLGSKNTLTQGKSEKIFKVTTKPKVLENLKRSWKKSWNLKSLKEYELC